MGVTLKCEIEVTAHGSHRLAVVVYGSAWSSASSRAAAKRSAEWRSPRAPAAASGGGLGAEPPSAQFVWSRVVNEESSFSPRRQGSAAPADDAHAWPAAVAQREPCAAAD